MDLNRFRLDDPLLVKADWDDPPDVAMKVAEAQLGRAITEVANWLDECHEFILKSELKQALVDAKHRTFQVNDFVVVSNKPTGTDDLCSPSLGMVGKVVHVTTGTVSVEFPRFTTGHDAGGNGVDGHCWDFYYDFHGFGESVQDLELI